MGKIMMKYYFCLLICLLFLKQEVYSQSNCLPNGTITNGINAQLKFADDGVSLLGIRVNWTIRAEYSNCQFSSLRVHLNHQTGGPRRDIQVTVSNNTADFYNLDCNTEYTPSVRMVVSTIGYKDVGEAVFFGGRLRTAPSKLQKVCIRSDTTLHSSRVNISWPLLPCHLQNGADITGYIIQYTPTSGGVVQHNSTRDKQLECSVGSSSLYTCLFHSTLFGTSGVYQVAAVNRYGTGPFSGPVNYNAIVMPDAHVHCYNGQLREELPIALTTYLSLTTTTRPLNIDRTFTIFNSVIDKDKHKTSNTTSPTVWIAIAGVLFVIVVFLTALSITLATISYIFWKRSTISNKDQRNPKVDKSEIDLKECSAYGQVTSIKSTSGDEQHVYESTN